MVRSVWLIVLVFFAHASFGQVRLGKLVLAKGQHFKIVDTDIAVIDTLVMNDSSFIELNWQKKDNFIHSKLTQIGNGCQIIGTGRAGKTGKEGTVGVQFGGPCRAGAEGANGSPGIPGGDGINLSLYLGKLELNGTLTININGGNGGDGGRGGAGGNGSPGTKVCAGGDGGRGGNGGAGSNGGKSGDLLIQYNEGPDLRLVQGDLLVVKAYGGFAGLGGEGGSGGQAGLGPTRDGKNGGKGTAGPDGLEGKAGKVNFEKKL